MHCCQNLLEKKNLEGVAYIYVRLLYLGNFQKM